MLSTCPHARLFLCRLVYLSTDLLTCLSLAVDMSTCLLIYLSTDVLVYLPPCLRAYLSICLPMCLSPCLPVYLSICAALDPSLSLIGPGDVRCAAMGQCPTRGGRGSRCCRRNPHLVAEARRQRGAARHHGAHVDVRSAAAAPHGRRPRHAAVAGESTEGTGMRVGCFCPCKIAPFGITHHCAACMCGPTSTIWRSFIVVPTVPSATTGPMKVWLALVCVCVCALCMCASLVRLACRAARSKVTCARCHPPAHALNTLHVRLYRAGTAPSATEHALPSTIAQHRGFLRLRRQLAPA